MNGLVNIARCPEHGLHGERSECFVCGGPVEQVPMIPAERTPLHELVDLCREQGLALDFAIYGPDDPVNGDDTKSTYLGGARITGFKGDPMNVILAGVRARRDAARESS